MNFINVISGSYGAALTRGSIAAAVLLCASAPLAHAADDALPDGPGVNLIYSHCQTCHSLQYVEDAKGLLPAQWDSLIASMQDYGVEVSDEDKAKILEYLKTYMGPNPPPEAEAETAAAAVDGSNVFANNCAACHGADGQGQPGYFPELAGNSDLFLGENYPVQVVLHGLSGPITVNGQTYNGAMPALDHLSDDEIAAVVHYVRNAWGNDEQASTVEPVTVKQVAQQRDQDMSATDVHAHREQLTAQ